MSIKDQRATNSSSDGNSSSCDSNNTAYSGKAGDSEKMQKGIHLSMMSDPISMETTRELAVQALALTVQDWNSMGQGEDPSVSEAALFDDNHVALEVGVGRVTSLLLVRVVAIELMAKNSNSDVITDISTSSICRQALIASDDDEEQPPWPFVTTDILRQLRQFVRNILQSYSDLPFHNFQHAVTVTVNCNKLLDLMLAEGGSYYEDDGRRKPPPTFGLRHDPLSLAALLFAGFSHDVQHQGVTNQQLVTENHPTALLYNDQSVQEKHATCVAFSEFLKADYEQLRKAMFVDDDAYRYFRATAISAVMSTDIASPEQTIVTKSKWKEAFGQNKVVVTQNNNNKRRGSLLAGKNVAMPPRNRRGSNCSEVSDVTTDLYFSGENNGRRRLSNDSEYYGQRRRQSNDDSNYYGRRRQSNDSNYSRRRMSGDSNDGRRRMSGDHNNNNIVETGISLARQQQQQQRRLSNASVESFETDFAADSVVLLRTANKIPNSTPPRRFSLDASVDVSIASTAQNLRPSRSYDSCEPTTKLSDSTKKQDLVVVDKLGVEAIGGASSDTEEKYHTVTGRNQDGRAIGGGSYPRRGVARAVSGESVATFVSFAAESIGVNQKRLDGARMTRHRASKDTTSFVEKNGQSESRLTQSQIGVFVKEDEVELVDLEFEDSSFSLTPPSSEDELVVAATRPSYSSLALSATNESKNGPRRASTGMVPTRLGSLTGQRIDEDLPNCTAGYNNLQPKSFDMELLQQYNSNVDGKKYRKRLGIRRSIDFSGETIEIYSKRSSMGAISALSGPLDDEGFHYDEAGSPLRASVILEAILRAADAGHCLQSWENMIRWSSRLFLELSKAHRAGRGHDPGLNWFDNQIRVMDNYLTPLALQLDDAGVFGESVGAMFAQNVDDIKDQWLEDGFELTCRLREEAAELFPSKEDHDFENN